MKSALQTVRRIDKGKERKPTIIDCMTILQKASANHFHYKLFDSHPCHVYLKENSHFTKLVENDEKREDISELQIDSSINGYNH